MRADDSPLPTLDSLWALQLDLFGGAPLSSNASRRHKVYSILFGGEKASTKSNATERATDGVALSDFL